MNLSERIDRYIDGLLIGEEKKSFESEMNRNPGLQKQVEERRQLRAIFSKKYHYPDAPLGSARDELGLEDTQELEIDDDLFRFHYHYKNTENDPDAIRRLTGLPRDHNPKMLNILGRIMTLAATVALITVLTAGVLKIIGLHKEKKLHEELYTRWFQPDTDSTYLQIASGKSPGIFPGNPEEKVPQRINDGELFRDGLMNDKDLLFYAIAAMKNQQYEIAISILNDIAGSKEKPYYHMAIWYSALANLRTGKTDKAKELFRSLCQHQDKYSSSACKILDDLEKSTP